MPSIRGLARFAGALVLGLSLGLGSAFGANPRTGSFVPPLTPGNALMGGFGQAENATVDGGGLALPGVATLAGQRALLPGQPRGIIRLGYAAAGDSPPLVFLWQASCPGTADNRGFLVAPLAGGSGCWQAIYPDSGIDPRWFGAVVADDGNGTDSSASFAAIETACGQMGNYPQQVSVTVGFVIKNWGISCLTGLQLYYAGALFAPLATITPTENVITYQGTRGFSLTGDGIGKIQCPIYSLSDPSAIPNGDFAFRARAASDSTQIDRIVVRGIRVLGCRTGIQIDQARQVWIENNVLERQWDSGIDYSDQVGTLAVAQGRVFIRNNVGYMQGGYFITYPQTQTLANEAPGYLEMTGNTGIGAGWIQQKYCYDVTAVAFENSVFDNSCYDTYSGGAEFKRTFPTAAAGTQVIPYTRAGDFARVRYSTHIDQGSCADVPYEVGSDSAPGLRSRLMLDVTCSYIDPAPWQAGAGYSLGDVRSANDGFVYQVQQSGISGSTGPTGGPTGGPLANGNGITDGTVVWAYRQALPTNQGATFAEPTGGNVGTSYALTDELTISGCTESPVLRPTLIEPGGAITALRVVYEGVCQIPPANPVTLVGGGGSGATASLAWHYEAANLLGGNIEASSNLEIHYHLEQVHVGAQFRTRGSSNQTIRNLIVEVNGFTEDSCLSDDISNEFGVQNGFVQNALVRGDCTALGHQPGAVNLLHVRAIPAWSTGGAFAGAYFQNDLVTKGGVTYVARCSYALHPLGCVPGATGPTGTGNGIVDGTGGLTWNSTSQAGVAFLTYNNLVFEGSFENQGARCGLGIGAAQGSINGSSRGANWTGGTCGLSVSGNLDMVFSGGKIAVTRQTSGVDRPVRFDGANATGTLTMLGTAVTTTATPSTNANQGWVATGGATAKVQGQLLRGVVTADPTGSYACAPGDSYALDVPTAAAPVGYACTGAGTFTAY